MKHNRIVFYLLGLRYKFNLSKCVKFVGDSQRWTKEQIVDYQNKNLKAIVRHAYEHTVYYKRLFDSLGITPDNINSVDDLSKLPILHKKDISEHHDDLLARDYKQYHPMRRTTGGTTGTAFPYYNDVASWALNWALKIRTFEWGGYHFGKDRIGVMAGGSLMAQDKMSLKSRFWRYLNNFYSMPITHMDNVTMNSYYQELRRQKIKFLRGYPSALYTFAEYLNSIERTLHMKCVFTTAEMLYEHQRLMIEKVFKCKVIDMYGCGDGMGFASECEAHEGMHIGFEASIMQIVDTNGQEVVNGEEGEIVLTSLFDYAMPLIRYAPGDMAITANNICSCKRNSPLIKKLIGRTSDIIRLGNGRILNGLSIPFEEMTGEIDNFQIIQKDTNRIEILLATKREISQERMLEITKMMRYHCGEDVKIDVNIVNEIAKPKSGKMRYVISELKNIFQNESLS